MIVATKPYGSRNHLPPEVVSHLRGLLEGYARLRATNNNANPECDKEIAALLLTVQELPETLWWSDMATAELCIISLLGEQDVRARLQGWRRRMHEVLGDARYLAYLSNAPDIASSGVETLRADLSECIRSVYYFYGAYGLAARSRTIVGQKTLTVATIILLIEGVISLLLSWSTAPESVGGHSVIFPTASHARDILELVIATSAVAVVGSVISVQRRLQDPGLAVDPFYVYVQTTYDRYSVAFVSPLFGAVFGAVMYALLAAQLFASALVTLTFDGSPQHPKDIAALLLLGFLSGFAETLVPDALTRLAARAVGGPGTSANPGTAGGAPSTNGPSGLTGGGAGGDSTTPPRQLVTTPGDITPAATALGQDPSLASEPTPADDARSG